jgi:hypothetical protein
MAQRIKGQEVRIIFTSPVGVETSLTDITSFEVEPQLEILSEGYLGETTERKDDIFKGVRGRAELHLESQEYFQFVQRVLDRSQRRTAADGKFNVVATLSFPNGQRPRVLLDDVFFGPPPVNVSSREDYVSATVEFECSFVRFLF